jgi:hypothetical protein
MEYAMPWAPFAVTVQVGVGLEEGVIDEGGVSPFPGKGQIWWVGVVRVEGGGWGEVGNWLNGW